MKITVIDNYDSFVYNLIRYVEEESNAEVLVMRNDKIDYEILAQSDAILLSPGPGVPNDAGDLIEVIDRFHKKIPILGVCLGHQAIANYFGFKLELCSHPFHGEASKIELIDKMNIFSDLPDFIEVGRYHSWKVNRLLKSPLKITAISEENEIMAFKHEELPIYGIQFHPESILTPKGRIIIRNWVKSLNN